MNWNEFYVWISELFSRFTIKSIIAKKLFEKHPDIKKKLWWWNLWTRWYYVNTVWMYGGYDTIKNYVKNQWIEQWYKERHKNKNERIFRWFELWTC